MCLRRSRSLEPRPVNSKRSVAMPRTARPAAMRLAATTSLPQVKQCANSAVASGGPSGKSSRAARFCPFCPVNCQRSLRMMLPPCRWCPDNLRDLRLRAVQSVTAASLSLPPTCRRCSLAEATPGSLRPHRASAGSRWQQPALPTTCHCQRPVIANNLSLRAQRSNLPRTCTLLAGRLLRCARNDRLLAMKIHVAVSGSRHSNFAVEHGFLVSLLRNFETRRP